jgi:transposase
MRVTKKSRATPATDILASQLAAENGWCVTFEQYDTKDGAWHVHLRPTRQSAVCSGCGQTKRCALDTKTTRTWRHLDAWSIRTLVIAPLRRVRCRRCGVRVELVPWARPRSRLTHMFEAEILRRARSTSIAGVCRQLALHWTTVMRLITHWVKESVDKRFRRRLRYIGVDEVSYGRGQNKYLTIVWDHEAGHVVWIGEGKEQDTLDGFFRKLGLRRAGRLIAVTMDMAKGYINAVLEHAAQADIVFDRFHIERHLTEAVNEVRKAEFWRKAGPLREAIRGKKFLLLKKRRRLHWRRRRDLDELFRLNRRLQVAYMLKEQFDDVWHYRTEFGMGQALERWRRMLRWQRIGPLNRFWQMIERHWFGVLGWAKHGLTNAALEGNNSRIRGISQRAHGYRNPSNLMQILYFSCCR